MDNKFFINNRESLKDLLEDNSAVVLFAGEAPQRSADQNYPFTPNRNFYYLAGVEREKAIYMAVKAKGEYKEYLFIEKGDSMLEKWIGKRMTIDEAKVASGIEDIKYLESFEGALHQQIMGQDLDYLYLDLEKRDYNAIPTKAYLFAQNITKDYPQLKVKNIYNKIAQLRVKKSEVEIEKIRRAIDITQEGIKALMNNCRSGLYEYQLEAYFDFTLKNLGAKNRAFNTIAAAGPNATVLHYEDNNAIMEEGQLILFDLGAEFEHYCADISRTFPVSGKFSPRQKEVYNVVLKALVETTEMIKPGVTLQELNEHTKKVLANGCKELGIIKDDKELAKYYYHGVSHFLGLDTHDVGDRIAPLEPGMVLTVEPGLYIEEEGIGIRIEDDILVTHGGYEVLSKDIIKTVEEIEDYMGK